VIAAELRAALAAAAREAGFPGAHSDAGLRDGGIAGRYTSSLPLRLASSTGRDPEEIATPMAAALSRREDISDVAVTGNGYLTITVTGAALGWLAVRMAEAGPGSACSAALRGTTVAAPPQKDLAAASSWAEAHELITAQVTARLAEAAGATIKVHE
jgi:arginyl-tRNA synthetase